MSVFVVEHKSISDVTKHPNADRLDLAKVDGLEFQFVTGRDQYFVGDEVVYFPVDSILPESIIKLMGLEGRLSGAAKNRVKTVKLRGEISQGLVCGVADLTELFPEFPNFTDLTSDLGVTKYEPPEVKCTTGNLCRLPDGMSSYDIEGADRYPKVLDELRSQGPVWVSEKLEGQNCALRVHESEEPTVCQRKHSIEPVDGKEHYLWVAINRQDLVTLGHKIRGIYDVPWVALRGEACGPGIQKNIYGLKEVTIFLFDVLTPDGYISSTEFLSVVGWYDKEHEDKWLSVPSLYRGDLDEYLRGRSMQECSNGESHLALVKREGVVIKPLIFEQHSNTLHGKRCFIKQRSPEYLAAEK